MFFGQAKSDAAPELIKPIPVDAIATYLRGKFPATAPGASVGIFLKGKPVLLTGFGLADIKTKAKLDHKSVFDLASMSKQFTAVSVLMLVERGKVKLDEPISTYLPELKDTFDAKKPVTVKHLLQQTSGYPDYLGLFKGGDAEFAKSTNEDFMQLLAKHKRTFEPGTRHEYSNSNYALLPIIVKRADGRTFAKFVSDEIFTPAGMKASVVMDDPNITIANRVMGYTRGMLGFGGYKPSRKDGATCGDGNLFTSIDDLGQWAKVLDDRKLLKGETWDLAWSANLPANIGNMKQGYACGWIAEETAGHKRIWHNGGWAGTSTMMIHYPAEKLSIFVLCNSDQANATSVGLALANLCFGKK